MAPTGLQPLVDLADHQGLEEGTRQRTPLTRSLAQEPHVRPVQLGRFDECAREVSAEWGHLDELEGEEEPSEVASRGRRRDLGVAAQIRMVQQLSAPEHRQTLQVPEAVGFIEVCDVREVALDPGLLVGGEPLPALVGFFAPAGAEPTKALGFPIEVLDLRVLATELSARMK